MIVYYTKILLWNSMYRVISNVYICDVNVQSQQMFKALAMHIKYINQIKINWELLAF